MKIDTTKIDGYEEMTAEEKLVALENFEIEHDDSKLKNLLNKANSEAAQYKKQLKEKMSEDERVKAEQEETLQALKDKLNTLENEKKISEFEKSYLAIGYSPELATETAKAMANGDLATVFANQKKVMDMKVTEVKEQAINSQAGLSTGNTPNVKTETEEEKLANALRKYANI